MRIEESKYTEGMWFVVDHRDNIVSVMFSRDRAVKEMKRRKDARDGIYG